MTNWYIQSILQIMTNIISINKLSKKYHSKGETTAIKNLTLSVKEGEYLAIVGPSGCGKSTLLSILSGIEKKSSGSIILHKDNIKFGYMLQEDCLFPWLNILDNCLLGLKINKEITKENKEYVIKLLNDYGLHDFIYSYPNSLSGGMRQRVALIRTLAIKPDILLLDEPFSALDYQTRLALSDDVYKMIKDNQKTVIMITHDIAEAISMADRVVVLTNRPCQVKKVYDINLTNKSTPIENRKCKEFSKYYDEIWKELDFHV